MAGMIARVAGMLSASSINVALLAALSLVLAKVLPVEAFGMTRTATAYLGILVIFAHATLPSAAAAFVAGTRSDDEKTNYVITSFFLILGLSLLVTLIAEAVFLYSGFWEGQLRWVLAAFMLVLPLTCFIQLHGSLLQAIGNYRQFSIYLILTGLVQLVIIASLATFYDTEGWVVGRYLAAILLFFLGTYYVRTYFRLRRPAIAAARELVGFSSVLILSGIMSNIMSWIDIIVLERMSGDLRQVAIYGVAALFWKSVMFVPMAVGRTYFKRIAEAVAEPASLWQLQKSFLLAVTAICAGVAAILYFFAPPMLDLLYDENYRDSTPVLRILCLAVLTNGVWTGLAVINNATKRPRHAVIISAVGLIVFLPLLYFWVPLYGAIGAAWAVVLANTSGSIAGLGLLRWAR